MSTRVPTLADQTTVMPGGSRPAILRVMISANAQQQEEATPNSAAGSKLPAPGRTTISIPAMPAATAAQRRSPTTSPSSGMDRTVTMSGERKLIVVACAMVMLRMP